MTLEQIFILNNIQINNDQLEKLKIYKKLLLEWNKKINLISKKAEQEIDYLHFIDSAKPINLLPNKSPVIDLGSGAGFPGIVLKILKPEIHITLCETKTKKINFLQKSIETLNLENIVVFNPAVTKTEKKFELLVCRAFGDLKKIIKEAGRYLIKNGTIAAYKGKANTIKQEIQKISHDVSIVPYTIKNENEEIERNLVEITFDFN